MNDTPSYLVILKDNEQFDLQILADVLSRSLVMPRYDATTQIRRSWGILHRTPEMDAARKLERSLRKENIEAFILSDAELKTVPQVKILEKAYPQPEGLVYQEEGQDRILHWTNVLLLCAGKILESTTVKETLPRDGKATKWIARTGISVTTAVAVTHELAKERTATKNITDLNYFLDLVAGEGFESIRICGNSFDYACLGDRKAYNALLNFKNLVMDIAQYLPNTIKNQRMRAIVAKPEAKELKYTNMNEYENEKLWLMQLTESTR